MKVVDTTTFTVGTDCHLECGDIIITPKDRSITGFSKKWKVRKKGATALTCTRYFWWDRIIDYFRKEPSELET
jgi:hypothetical protein